MAAALPVDDARADAAVSLRPRLAAATLDAASLLLALTAAGLGALAFLLLATEWGAFDVEPGEAALAASIWAAAGPAWLAWNAAGLWRNAATAGQRRAGLRVRGAAWRRVARLLLHPFSLPTWAWLALVAGALLGGDALAAVGVVAAMIALGGVLSAALLLARPGAPALHDVVAGTRLERAP